MTGPRRRRVEHLISTQARPVRCHGCGAAILAGVEGGIPARVEPAPVDAAGELAALMAGLATYALRGGELALREVWAIRAGVPARGVWVMHDCEGLRFV